MAGTSSTMKCVVVFSMEVNASEFDQPLRRVQVPAQTRISKRVLILRMNVHAAEPQQPLGRFNMAAPTRTLKRVIVPGMNVHATQPKQPLGRFNMAAPTRIPKREIVDGMDVDAFLTCQPLGYLQMAASKWPPPHANRNARSVPYVRINTATPFCTGACHVPQEIMGFVKNFIYRHGGVYAYIRYTGMRGR